MDERFMRQISFIVEIDKIKSIIRKTKLFDGSRRENDAEHSWHLAVMTLILAEYSSVPVDILKVIKMVLIHDLVEIDAGDKLVYSRDISKTDEDEINAAERIFGLLPSDQKKEMIDLWTEFEAKETPEAKFAAAVDRLEPLMQNLYNDADVWRANGVSMDKLLSVNAHIEHGSSKLWNYAKSIFDECAAKGFIR